MEDNKRKQPGPGQPEFKKKRKEFNDRKEFNGQDEGIIDEGTIEGRNAVLEAFRSGMDRVLGAGACHVLTIRPVGGVRLV